MVTKMIKKILNAPVSIEETDPYCIPLIILEGSVRNFRLFALLAEIEWGFIYRFCNSKKMCALIWFCKVFFFFPEFMFYIYKSSDVTWNTIVMPLR